MSEEARKIQVGPVTKSLTTERIYAYGECVAAPTIISVSTVRIRPSNGHIATVHPLSVLEPSQLTGECSHYRIHQTPRITIRVVNAVISNKTNHHRPGPEFIATRLSVRMDAFWFSLPPMLLTVAL